MTESRIKLFNSNSDADKQNISGKPDYSNNSEFICGVVEGFYGKPWTFAQRKDLFGRLRELNLNAFMYAPKDDTKHRAKWRQMYNEVEARELKILIDEAAANGIDFYYSLAPGLDMVYSSYEDLAQLYKKFDQLKSLGCKSFAILFDDIEPSLTHGRDRALFKDNYGAAQVSVTNSIYEYLNKPKFLFCPTEYCESRAVPNVCESLYLNTIGAGLHQGIDIMWSGCRVISRCITEESIRQLNSVIRRPALIWENLHANDYDKKRVYLGPYSGRSTKIIPQLRGVLTNPNCEYEANYIAIHTLAQWSKCTNDANPHNKCNQNQIPTNQVTTATCPTALEPEQQSQSESSDATTGPLDESVYDPDRALARALRDWLPHVLSARSLPKGINVSMSHQRNDDPASNQISKEEDVCSSSGGGGGGNGSKQDQLDACQEVDMEAEGREKSPATGSATSKNDVEMSDSSPAAADNTQAAECPKSQDQISCDSSEMQAELQLDPSTITCMVCSAPSVVQHKDGAYPKVDIDSLALLVDFFYLPFEHGFRGHAFLNDIRWLIEHSGVLVTRNGQQDDERQKDARADQMKSHNDQDDGKDEQSKANYLLMVELWLQRAERLSNLCGCINKVIDTLVHDCPNKLLMAELYPYMAELRDVITMLGDYIQYLRHREPDSERFYFNEGPKRREYAPCDEQEPWVHRGGLIGDVQRLISLV